MVGIQPEVQLLLLGRTERDFFWYFRDTVPNILYQQNPFRNAKTEYVLGN